MSNLTDYLKWRGDLSFLAAPLNPVDSLLFCELSYVKLQGIVPKIGSGKSISLREASEKFFLLHTQKELQKDKTATRFTPYIMGQMGKTERFRDLKLWDYEEVFDTGEESQFAALTIELPNHIFFLAYRGTDDTIVGWKEDFNMSFLSKIPAQKKSLDYLNQVAGAHTGRLVLGGHSKGGNLAIYAGVQARAGIKRRILHIYNNDGPGFRAGTLDSAEYEKMMGKILTFVPQSSLVGMLLEREEPYQVIESDKNNGILQHDPLSWQVQGDHFLEMGELTPKGKCLDQALQRWLAELDDEKRQVFVDTLFGILLSGGAQTVSDVASDFGKQAVMMLKTYQQIDPGLRAGLTATIRALSAEYKRQKKEERLEKKRKREESIQKVLVSRE